MGYKLESGAKELEFGMGIDYASGLGFNLHLIANHWNCFSLGGFTPVGLRKEGEGFSADVRSVVVNHAVDMLS